MGWSPTKILYQTKEAEGFLFSRPLPISRDKAGQLRGGRQPPCGRAAEPTARARACAVCEAALRGVCVCARACGPSTLSARGPPPFHP